MRFIITLLFSLSIFAGQLDGFVSHVHDGDTITIKSTKNKSYKIRLLGIDAPELSQAYGNESKAHLIKLIDRQFVSVLTDKKDDFGRYLGVIKLGKTNINQQMVKQGYAWHFVRYSNDKSLTLAENQARQSKLGLWSQKDPVAPWDYRKAKRPTKDDTNKTEAIEALYWITNSSNKRHNSRCRWFKGSKGRLGKKSEGIACKICGG